MPRRPRTNEPSTLVFPRNDGPRNHPLVGVIVIVIVFEDSLVRAKNISNSTRRAAEDAERSSEFVHSASSASRRFKRPDSARDQPDLRAKFSESRGWNLKSLRLRSRLRLRVEVFLMFSDPRCAESSDQLSGGTQKRPLKGSQNRPFSRGGTRP